MFLLIPRFCANFKKMINIWPPPEIPSSPRCVGLATALQREARGAVAHSSFS